jgi:hypothetical protein
MSSTVLEESIVHEAGVKAFLADNASYHLSCVAANHSWPCGLWINGSDSVSVDDLLSHGIFPKNWKVLTVDPI